MLVTAGRRKPAGARPGAQILTPDQKLSDANRAAAAAD
jgi:hypothetical protein